MASLALAGLLACAAVAYAHPGGLDRHGCHTNRKTGLYHCHRSATPVSAVPLAPGPPPGGTPATPAQLRETVPTRAFRNCTEARARGAAPVRRGDPGYGPHLDRDGDGVGCEPYRGR
ncbi:excalibur calcium-binding domain-containing protein [Pseudoxanthomonas mexicana]|nr:excalibur calcium-binding domain-containing protein [Pseudoxanthomonas sp.]